MLIPKSALRATVLVEPSLGNTGDGETYGGPVPVLGSLNRNRKLIRSRTGDTVVAEAVLVVRPGQPVKVGDRVSEGADVWIVEKVAPALVGPRVHHVEVWLR